MFDHQKRLRLAAGFAAIGALAVPAVSATALDSGHQGGRSPRQTAAAYREMSSKTLAPGVRLVRYSSKPHGRKAISDVLTVNLGSRGVSAGILSGAVTQTAPVGSWAKQSKAIAAVNGDYFDISNTQAPNGTVIRGGRILKGTRPGQEVVGQGRDGRLRVGMVYLRSTVSWGHGKSARVEYYNTVLSQNILPRNGFAVLDSEWGGAPLRIPHASGKIAVIAVGANHKVIKTYRKVSGQKVPRGGMLVIATGSEASLSHLRRGATFTDKVGMSTSAPVPFAWGMGHGLTLMRRDSVIHNWPNDNDPRDARTALGWKDDGHTMILVTVEEGRGSAGEDVNEIADELAAQGATDGVLLDGGGSTTLVTRTRGHVAQIGPVATPGNIERHVPIGIGIFVTKH